MKVSFEKCRPKGLCFICGLPKSDMKAIVQVNCFRGDDEVYKIHSQCKNKFIEKLSKEEP